MQAFMIAWFILGGAPWIDVSVVEVMDKTECQSVASKMNEVPSTVAVHMGAVVVRRGYYCQTIFPEDQSRMHIN